MSDMNVTYDDMHGAADHIRDEHGQLEEKLDGLKNYVKDLVENGYTTSASSAAFDESFEEFTTGAKQCLEGAIGMAQFLDDTADGLQEEDEARAQAIRGG